MFINNTIILCKVFNIYYYKTYDNHDVTPIFPDYFCKIKSNDYKIIYSKISCINKHKHSLFIVKAIFIKNKNLSDA